MQKSFIYQRVRGNTSNSEACSPILLLKTNNATVQRFRRSWAVKN